MLIYDVHPYCFYVLVLTSLYLLMATTWYPVLADITSLSKHDEHYGNEVVGDSAMMKFPLIKRRRSSLSSVLSSSEDVTTTENLKGRPGQGYYIAILIGTPPQRVSFILNKKRF